MACRNCGHHQPLAIAYVCPACFGPLEVAYDLGVVAATFDRASIAARAPGIWRYLELLPVETPPSRSLPVGSTPLLAADRLAPTLGVERLWLKDDTRNPTLSFKDRAVALAAARAVVVRRAGPGLRLHRQPGRRDGGRGGRGRAARLRVHPVGPRAGQGRPRAGLRGDGRAHRRHVRRRQSAVPGDRRRDRLGLRQHQPPAVLRGGIEDARLRDRRDARLALTGRRGRTRRQRGHVHAGRARLRGAGRARAHRAPADPLRRRPGGRLRPGGDGVRDRRRPRSSPSARRTRSSARWPSATRPTVATPSSWRAPAAGRSRPSTTSTRRRASATSPGSRACTPRRQAA